MTHDSLISFNQIRDLCLKHHADLVIGGDLFDRARPESEVVLRYQSVVNILVATGLKVYFIQGQHEKSTPPWAYVGENAFCLDRKIYGVNDGKRDRSITGLDWRPAEDFNAIINVPEAPKTDIFVGHQVWISFHYGVAEADFATLHNNHQLLLVGDYHKPHHVGMLGCDAYSTGSISMMSIDEPESKQVLLFDDGLTPNILQLKTRPITRWVLRTKEDLDSLMAPNVIAGAKECCDPFDKPILDVVYDDGIPNVIHHVRESFAKDTYLWLRPIKKDPSHFSAAYRQDIGDADDGVITAISKLLKGKERDLATRLWNADHVTSELEEIVEEEIAT